MPQTTAADDALHAALHGVRALLLDLDGVLVMKGRAIPGAADALAELERRAFPYLVVTNTSLVSRATLAADVGAEGIPVPPGRIVSALSATAGFLRRELGDRAVYVICSHDARAELVGLRLVDPAQADADPASVAAVVVGDSPDQLTRENLDRAFRLVMSGAELIGMHRNPWWHTAAGPTLDSGAYLAGLEYATGTRARIVGKPAAPIFREALGLLRDGPARSGAPRLRASQVAMVGDDLSSDVRGGRRAGLRTILVRTGKHGDAEMAAAARGRRGWAAPDAVAPSIAEVVAALEPSAPALLAATRT